MESINILYSGKQDLIDLQDKVFAYPNDQILIQVFSGIADKEILLDLQAELNELYPGISVIGTTTDGEIFGSSVVEQQIVISVSLFNKTKVSTCYADDGDSLDGRIIGNQIISKNPKVTILFSTGLYKGIFRNNSQYLQQIHDLAPNLIIAGGQAGVAPHQVETYVFTENWFSSNGSVAANLQGEHLNAWTYRNDGWKPIGRHMTVSHSKGNIVHKIDNLSVKEIYQHYLGIGLDITTPNNPTIEYPLTYTRNNLLLKNVPIQGFTDDSIEFLYHFEEGEQVRFSFCDIPQVELEAHRIKEKLKQIMPETIFVYSCAGRKLIFGMDISVDSEKLAEIANTTGFFTAGEFYTDEDKQPHCLIQTMTVLALSENTAPEITTEITEYDPFRENTLQRSIKTLRMLTNLITATSEELEKSNLQLTQMANMDAMTDLYNRRFFDENLLIEIERHSRANAPLSLILLDVDFFKQFNDVYGHVSGDECLATIGKILNTSLKRPSDIAFRYGGEEMGCLLPSTDYNGAKMIAEKIRENIEKQAIPHQKSAISKHVTVSIGFVTYWFNKNHIRDKKTLVTACDRMLYQAKEKGRNQIIGCEIKESES